MCFRIINLCPQIGNINFHAAKIHYFLDSTKLISCFFYSFCCVSINY